MTGLALLMVFRLSLSLVWPPVAVSVCDNILHVYLYGGDLLFVILKGIYGFKFPKRFLEISSGDLTSFPLQLI